MSNRDGRYRDDTTPEVLPGAEEQTPDDIVEFMVTHNVGAKYTCMLKEVIPGGGPHGILKNTRNEYLDVDTVGAQWGPGEYIWSFAYKVEGPNGVKAPTIKEYRIMLPERAWRKIYDNALRERSRVDKAAADREISEAKQNAELRAAEKGISTGVAGDPLEVLKASMDTLKSLGVKIGGDNGSQKIDWLGIGTVLAPLVLNFIQNGKSERDKLQAQVQAAQAENMKFLMTMMMNGNGKGESTHMKSILDMAFGAMKQVTDFAQIMKPEEKRDWVDKIFEVVEKGLPQILEIAKMSQAERNKNYLYQAAVNSPPVKAVQSDTAMQIDLTQKLDKTYGFQTTDEILKATGITRHESTMGNKGLFPSKGFGADGAPVPEAGQETPKE
jgi:hypothetical protein